MLRRSILPFIFLLGLLAVSLTVPAVAQADPPEEGTEEATPSLRRPSRAPT